MCLRKGREKINKATSAGVLGDDTFREGAVSGFLLILFSELGDKTFFIALLLALRQSQGLVFTGTFGALAIMTVISVSVHIHMYKANDVPVPRLHLVTLLNVPTLAGSFGPGPAPVR